MTAKYKYLFLDEGGNFDFAKTGTDYLVATAVVADRPFHWDALLLELKYDLLEGTHEPDYFHASEDRPATRKLVFNAICKSLNQFKIYSVILEKRKTHPKLQKIEAIYPTMLGWLVNYILHGVVLKAGNDQPPNVVVITDRIPVNKHRKAVEKVVKETLATESPTLSYRVLHHDSKSCFGLQVADYCNWAIYRKWSAKDMNSYNLIQTAVVSEFDFFKSGNTYSYS